MKKQLTRLLTFILILLALSVSLYSCGGDPVEFSVKFVVDGETHATVTTGGAEVIKLPENPTKEGYTFDGWYWDNGTWERPFTENSLLNEPLSADMSVYAKWKANAVEQLQGTDIKSEMLNVSEDKITGTVSNATEIFSFFNDITVAKDASYVVATDISCSQPIASKIVTLTIGDNTFYLLVTCGNDIKLYYVTLRRLPTYTVTFNENGGTAVENQTVEEGSLATVPAVPTRAGYTFAGWDYDFTKPVTQNATVSAIWTPIVYSIAYESDGGTHTNQASYTIEDSIALSNAEKEGYTFFGWYADSAYTNKVESIAEGTLGEITLYAKFMKKPRVELYVGGELWQTVFVDYADNYELPMPMLADSSKPGGWFDIDGNLYCDATTGTELINLPESIKLYYQAYKTGYTIIFTAEQLKSIAMNGKYCLMNNIDLGGAEWTPLGTFTGAFDGNGHVVSNFKVTGERQYAGLFGSNEGKIENLGIESFTIDVSYNGFVYAGGLVGENYGTIKGCYAIGNITSTGLSSSVGGLVGENSGTITGCYSTGDVTSTGTDYSSSVGGLVGENSGTITGCYATGAVTSTSADYSSSMGGLVGRNIGDITNCYATGNITSTGRFSCAGGLVGYNYYETITGCYATGDITSSRYAGGLVGYNDEGTITGCYRYSGQTFTVTINGTTTHGATNTEGTATSLENLTSKEWIETNLWKAEIEIWDFSFGYPIHNYDYINNAPVIEISTKEQLLKLQGQGLILNYILTNDIDLAGIEWNPIASFAGIFDGNGYAISNFKITGTLQYVGLFATNAGTIKNLGIESFTIDVSYSDNVYAGGLVGYNIYGTITNCYATGNVTSTSTEGNSNAGGLVGENYGDITNSYATGDVTSTDYLSYAGGLVGYNSSNGTITGCYASGDVTSTSTDYSSYAGGLVGYNYYGTITGCYASGDVTSTSTGTYCCSNASGLVGYNIYGTITNCYATGDVTSTSTSAKCNSYAGGLVGENSGTITGCYATGVVTSTGAESSDSYAGGLVGYNSSNGTITGSYATGDVTSTSTDDYSYAGGLVGYNDNGTISNCYSTGDVTSTSTEGNSYAGGLVGYNDYVGIITDCYRYSGQTFTVTKNGTTTYVATNTKGAEKDLATLKSVSFHTDTLGWSADVWSFTEGAHPKLKNIGN